MTATADAASYDLFVCTPVNQSAWTGFGSSRTDSRFNYANTCSATNGYLDGYDDGGTNIPSGEYTRWTLSAPTNTQITDVEIVRAELEEHNGFHATVQVGGTQSGAVAFGNGTSTGPWTDYSYHGLPGSSFFSQLRCSSNPCTNDGTSHARIKNMRVTFEDNVLPLVSASGTLLDAGPQRAQRIISLNARDRVPIQSGQTSEAAGGSGLQSTTVRVTNAFHTDAVITPLAGGGSSFADYTSPSATSPCDIFSSGGVTYAKATATATTPCLLDRTESYTVDTSQLPFIEGPNTIKICAEDFHTDSGSHETCDTRTVQIDNIAPGAPTIDPPKPANPTNITSATFSYSGDSGGSFECREYISSPPAFGTCPSSYTNLAAGTHTFEVRQKDAAGNIGPATSYSWTIDLTPPGAPTIANKPTNPTGSTSANFTYSGEPGGSFECREYISTPPAFGTCPQSYTNLAAGTHTFEVRQRDDAGNPGAVSSYSWTIDTTFPATHIDSKPVNPSNQTTAAFTYSSSKAGSTFKCDIGSGYTDCLSTGVSYPSLSEGSHTFKVQATDAQGHVDPDPPSYTWTIDTTPPAAPTIPTKPANPSNDANPAFSFNGESGATFQCRQYVSNPPAFGSCPSSYSNLADGSHTIDVKQIDAAGNQSSVTSYTWMIDTAAPPAPTIDTKPANPSNDASPAFSFSGESGATLECRQYVSNPPAYASCPSSYSNLTDGSHTVDVRQKDAAGNVSQVTSYSWVVDTTSPSVPTIGSKPGNPSNNANPAFSFSGESGG
ncbi:MAG: large repetitive protein, partial [Solirubrobacterales bacterium]|nr:large repetitive protein [Solirubrobacterales bacterium]